MKNLQIFRQKISSFWQTLKNRLNVLIDFSVYQETRTLILLWYLILMGLFVAIAIPAIRYSLIAEVTKRVKEDMGKELEKFEEKLIETTLLKSDLEADSELTATEWLDQNIYLAFDQFFFTHQAEDDNYLIAIVNSSFYKSNAPFLPKVIAPDSTLMGYWQQLRIESRGEIYVDDPQIGSIIYKAKPIKTTEKVIGVFVVAHLSAGERQEVLSSFYTIVRVLLLAISLASIIAWLVAGKILAPLKNFSNTLKSVSESNLSQRIAIEGKGELAKLGRSFNAMMEQIENFFVMQRNFINDAGHELKTPITIIRGHLEVMDIDTPEQRETIALTIDELDRMNRLVEDLLLLAKAERPNFLQINTIELSSFVIKLFDKLQTLGKRNWHLDNQILSAKMTGDSQRITQAIINLAENAVQHTLVDSLIVFGAKLEKDRVEFWLRDTGNGIALSEQERIFERFARIKNSHSCSGGSGLGLSIVRAVVEAHRGKIKVKSKLGIGSTFTLVFPLELNQHQNL